MRRRQCYTVASEVVPPLPPYTPTHITNHYVDRTMKGVCSKCNKYIGKGVFSHQKWCKA